MLRSSETRALQNPDGLVRVVVEPEEGAPHAARALAPAHVPLTCDRARRSPRSRAQPYCLLELYCAIKFHVPIVVTDVRASVNGAAMKRSLLGMSFLDRLSGYEVSGGRLMLKP